MLSNVDSDPSAWYKKEKWSWTNFFPVAKSSFVTLGVMPSKKGLPTYFFWDHQIMGRHFSNYRHNINKNITAVSLQSVSGTLAHHSYLEDPLPKPKIFILGRKIIEFQSFQEHVQTCLEGVWEYFSCKIVMIFVVDTICRPTIPCTLLFFFKPSHCGSPVEASVSWVDNRDRKSAICHHAWV